MDKSVLEDTLSQHCFDVFIEVRDELRRARLHHAKLHSAHEGYSVILEEVDELWEEVKQHRTLEHLAAMRKEAIQVAAMAIAFVVEVIDV